MNRKEKQDKINSQARFIAYSIYGNQPNRNKFIKAYDRINSRVFLDHNIRINTRLEETGQNNMYSVLSDEELDKVIISCNRLVHMYNKMLDKKFA